MNTTINGRGIDTHAHVFDATLPLSPTRRYTPRYSALPGTYLENLAARGFDRGVLVQPSFLGVDNSYLLAALDAHPSRFRGVIVVDPDEHVDLGALASRGVRGVRVNAIGMDVPDLTDRRWAALGRRMATLGWHLEIQARGSQWAELREALQRWPSAVVIDHLGLIPDGDDSTRAVLLALARLHHVWVKASGAYRNDRPRGVLTMLLDEVGVDRILFGTDWPFTSHEGAVTMDATIQWVYDVVGPEVFWHTLPANASRLFGWSQ